MNLLAIETASTVCGVALFTNSELTDIIELDEPRVHAEKLPVMVNDILTRNKAELSGFEGIAISSGPGSYTGLRIGMSLAKGLAFSVKIPLIPVPTLFSLENQVHSSEEHYICIKSHKDLVYAQKFNKGKPVSEPKCTAMSTLEKLPTFGFGLELVDGIVHNLTKVKPSAKHIGDLAIKNYNSWIQLDLNEDNP